jgi:AbrB family looped-hinge helix DNA binding protein
MTTTRSITRLSTKGQLIIPQEIRRRHGWHSGTELAIEEREDCLVLRPLESVPETTLDEVAGCAGYEGPALSLEEMEVGIAEGARRSAH